MKTQANTEAQQYMQQLQQNGWEEPAAKFAATQYAHSQYNAAQNKFYKSGEDQLARSQVATHFGQQYGVDPSSLLGYQTPAAMEAAAKAAKVTNDRIAALEGSKGGPAPIPKTAPRTFDSGEGGGLTNQQRKIAYATGKIDLTTAEYKALYNR